MTINPRLDELSVSVMKIANGALALDRDLDAVAPGDWPSIIHDAAAMEKTAHIVLLDAIVEARKADQSWAQIGRALNLSRQAAHQRYSWFVGLRLAGDTTDQAAAKAWEAQR